MKNLLIASAATAALAFSLPAFAQVTDGMQGTVTGQAEADTATVTQPATEAVENTSEPAPASADVTAPMPATTAEAETATTPDATVSAEAEASTQVAAAPTTGASATTETAAAAAVDMPQQVQVAVADGRYSTDDLNRAQLEALTTAPGAGR